MKLAIHSNQFDGRGTGRVSLDYAIGLRNLLGHEVICITSALSENEGLESIRKEFNTFTYDKKVGVHSLTEVSDAISKIVKNEKIDFIQMIKAGDNDEINPIGCKVGVHCVFNMNQPHGDVYAGVSDYLAKKHGKTEYVPHIVKNMEKTANWRSILGISEESLVIGRHGGYDTFDLPYVHRSVERILNERPEIVFLFLSTKQFTTHPRAIFVPWVKNQQDIFNFIHSCDAMLHGRSAGETFGLAAAEFSVANKPIITNIGYDNAHIDNLDGRALVYTDETELLSILRQITKEYFKENDWDVLSHKFSEKNVIEQYNKVFLT